VISFLYADKTGTAPVPALRILTKHPHIHTATDYESKILHCITEITIMPVCFAKNSYFLFIRAQTDSPAALRRRPQREIFCGWKENTPFPANTAAVWWVLRILSGLFSGGRMCFPLLRLPASVGAESRKN